MTSIRLAIVTTGLFRGGAEAMLYKLLAASPDQAQRTLVLSLGSHAPYADDLSELGVSVVSLDLNPSRPNPAALFRLRREIKRFRPDLVQGWMYHGNMAALIAARFAGESTPALWSIRQTLGDAAHEKAMTARLIRLGARFSRVPRRIVYNSRTSAAQHENIGYDATRRLVIPNGFDTTAFRPDGDARARVRRSLGIADSTVVVGLVARYHPMKDHVSFLRAAASLLADGLDATFVLLGRDLRHDHPVIGPTLRALGIADSPRVKLLSEVAPAEVAAMTKGFDIACSSSAWGDAFPNVLGEAMACGVPCVATTVGDVAWIVGDTGILVPPGDSEALAAALRSLVSATPVRRAALGASARRRVQEHFDIQHVARQYEALFQDTATVRTGSR